MSGQSDEQAEILKKILALLEDNLPRATIPTPSSPLGKKIGGRPPADLEIALYAAFVHLAAQCGFTTDEALNSLIRDVAKKRGLSPISRETLRRKLRQLRQRMPGSL